MNKQYPINTNFGVIEINKEIKPVNQASSDFLGWNPNYHQKLLATVNTIKNNNLESFSFNFQLEANINNRFTISANTQYQKQHIVIKTNNRDDLTNYNLWSSLNTIDHDYLEQSYMLHYDCPLQILTIKTPIIINLAAENNEIIFLKIKIKLINPLEKMNDVALINIKNYTNLLVNYLKDKNNDKLKLENIKLKNVNGLETITFKAYCDNFKIDTTDFNYRISGIKKEKKLSTFIKNTEFYLSLNHDLTLENKRKHKWINKFFNR